METAFSYYRTGFSERKWTTQRFKKIEPVKYRVLPKNTGEKYMVRQ